MTPGRPSPGEVPGLSDLVAQLGGPRGIADAVAPSVVFLVGFAATQRLAWAAGAALVVALVCAGFRLVRREPVRKAAGGLAGVALCALVASRTGNAADFYLPGLLLNIAYGSAYVVSVLLRWPLLGIFAALLYRQGTRWRRDPVLLAAYTRASLLWVAVYALRLSVQLPLYAAHATVALGIAQIGMGLPFFALATWLSYALVRRATDAGPAPAGRVTQVGPPAPDAQSCP